MKIAIHQPHYFPWLGYFHKLASSDIFILLNEVQLEKGSFMARNRVLNQNGDITFINIPADKKGFLEKEYKDIATKDNHLWPEQQKNKLHSYYRHYPFYSDVIPYLEDYYNHEWAYLCDWAVNSIFMCNKLLGIEKKVLLQSNIDYNKDAKKSDLVLEICKELEASVYLSGNGGSSQYLNRDSFQNNYISIEFQNFEHPTYEQLNSKEFVKGLSILDVLFSCGIEETKRLFWQTVTNNNNA